MPASSVPDLWVENPVHILASTPALEVKTSEVQDDWEDSDGSVDFVKSPMSINLSSVKDVSSLRPFDLED